MTEENLPPTETPAAPQAAPPAAKKPNPTRSLLLLSLLLLMLAALYYDRYVARPGSELAYQKVERYLQQELSKAGQTTASFDEVKEIVGCGPSSHVDHEYYTIERFSWRRGVLFASYFIDVVYRKDAEGDRVLYAVTHNEPPAEEDLPSTPVQPRKLTEEERNAKMSAGPPGGPPGAGAAPGDATGGSGAGPAKRPARPASEDKPAKVEQPKDEQPNDDAAGTPKDELKP